MFINNDDDDELAWPGQEMQLTDWPTSRQTPFESLLPRCTHTHRRPKRDHSMSASVCASPVSV